MNDLKVYLLLSKSKDILLFYQVFHFLNNKLEGSRWNICLCNELDKWQLTVLAEAEQGVARTLLEWSNISLDS